MDSNGILSLLEQFDDDLDDLEESLEPILKSSLSVTTSKLPLLDKAKLYILVTYAIESILFCGCQISAHGSNALTSLMQPTYDLMGSTPASSLFLGSSLESNYTSRRSRP